MTVTNYSAPSYVHRRIMTMRFNLGMFDAACLDEGLLQLYLPILVCMENPYIKTNDSAE